MLAVIMMICTLMIWFALADLVYPALAEWAITARQAAANIANLKMKEIISLLMVALAAVVFAVPVYFIESARR